MKKANNKEFAKPPKVSGEIFAKDFPPYKSHAIWYCTCKSVENSCCTDTFVRYMPTS